MDTPDGELRELSIAEWMATELMDDVRKRKRAAFDELKAKTQKELVEGGILKDEMPSEVLELQQTLREETDRGVVLAGAAFLDDALDALLRAHMVENKVLCDDFLRASGPLGSLSTRSTMCYLLGIIGADTRKEIDRIRKIRNDFAHSASPVSLNDATAASRCDELRFGLWLQEEKSPRRRFIRSLLTVLGIVHGAHHRAKRPVEGNDTPSPDALRMLSEKIGKLDEHLRVMPDISDRKLE